MVLSQGFMVSFESIEGMISRREQLCLIRERDDGDPFGTPSSLRLRDRQHLGRSRIAVAVNRGDFHLLGAFL